MDNSNVTVSVTEPASFTCSSRCDDTNVVCVGIVTEWTRSDKNQLPNTTRVFTGHLNSILHFPTTKSEDAGAYVCTGRIFNFSESDVASLTVTSKYSLCMVDIFFTTTTHSIPLGHVLYCVHILYGTHPIYAYGMYHACMVKVSYCTCIIHTMCIWPYLMYAFLLLVFIVFLCK